jgi:hypothetical protein
MLIEYCILLPSLNIPLYLTLVTLEHPLVKFDIYTLPVSLWVPGPHIPTSKFSSRAHGYEPVGTHTDR